MNVLRDTHQALAPGGLLLDFHPISPPWPRVVAQGEELGDLRDETFLDVLRATEGGLEALARAGLFERLASRTHDIAENYDEPGEVLEEWADDASQWMSADLEQRLRSTAGPVKVVERVVFHLYRTR